MSTLPEYTTGPTFCTNILPGADWPTHFEALKRDVPAIQSSLEALGKPRLKHLGVRIGAEAAAALWSLEQNGPSAALLQFQNWLKENDLAVYLINGFPYGQFHAGAVKDHVHTPDWHTEDRLQYSITLAHILAYLVPTDSSGGISTNPVTYAPWYDADMMGKWALHIEAARKMARWAVQAHSIWQATGKTIKLELEPEPDGILEDINSTLLFFEDYLWIYGKEVVMTATELNDEDALQLLKTHIQICYDVCHFAVLQQPITESLERFRSAGIGIGRLQISAALQASTQEGIGALAAFEDPIYLHQTAMADATGQLVKRERDLKAGLDWCASHPGAWAVVRTHFHVPLQLETYGPLSGTQQDIKEALRWWWQQAEKPHLEVETYTWHILPKELQKPLPESVAAEMAWLHDVLIQMR